MLRRVAVCLLLFTSSALRTSAQDSLSIRGTDTLHYSAAPASAPDSVRSRKPFFRRLVDYFGESTQDKTFTKKIDVTFAGGPSYSKNTSFGIGILAAGLYRLDRTDSVTQPSNVSLFGTISVSGFYAIGIEGNNIFKANRSRIDYLLKFSSAPRSLWGVGYDAGAHNPESTYVEKSYQVEGKYVYRVLPNTFVGGFLSFQHTKGLKFTDESYLYGQRTSYTMTGIGAIVEFDSRDFIPNPYKGIYVSLQETFYPKVLGNNDRSVWRTTFTADAYRQVWKGGVLAADLYAEFNSEGMPWPLLARLGGSYRMRGYYQGRYTDNDMITLQVELRQRIWRRIGGVVWAGAGNVFSRLPRFDWSHTLPNYGVGLRWELKKRVNIRVDYGFGRETSGFLLNINEAF